MESSFIKCNRAEIRAERRKEHIKVLCLIIGLSCGSAAAIYFALDIEMFILKIIAR